MGLKLPKQADRLKLDRSEKPLSFMPFGFAPFQQFALGNGDVFGLYWPIGREALEPLVAETFHDDGSLAPAFSSLDRFLDKAGDDEDGDHPGPPTLAEDPGSPLAAYEDAREALRTQDFERAVARLEQAIATLPEYTEALAALNVQMLRLGRHDDACRLAVRAVISPPCFGFSRQTERMWVWLSKQKHGPEDLADDPIWRSRAELDGPPGGGAKHNDVYLTLARAIDLYEQQGEIARALTLMQSYADFMNGETVSFKERYGFVFADWRVRQRAMSERLPDGPRVLD